jgi:hypothetical protein
MSYLIKKSSENTYFYNTAALSSTSLEIVSDMRRNAKSLLFVIGVLIPSKYKFPSSLFNGFNCIVLSLNLLSSVK